jgi:hypothetical protein
MQKGQESHHVLSCFNNEIRLNSRNKFLKSCNILRVYYNRKIKPFKEIRIWFGNSQQKRLLAHEMVFEEYICSPKVVKVECKISQDQWEICAKSQS